MNLGSLYYSAADVNSGRDREKNKGTFLAVVWYRFAAKYDEPQRNRVKGETKTNNEGFIPRKIYPLEGITEQFYIAGKKLVFALHYRNIPAVAF